MIPRYFVVAESEHELRNPGLGDLHLLEAALAVTAETAPCGDPLSSRRVVVEAAFDDRDVTSILSGVFHINANLAEIADDV